MVRTEKSGQVIAMEMIRALLRIKSKESVWRISPSEY
jgi:hypothetical protein